jgi:hypothetical protein
MIFLMVFLTISQNKLKVKIKLSAAFHYVTLRPVSELLLPVYW